MGVQTPGEQSVQMEMGVRDQGRMWWGGGYNKRQLHAGAWKNLGGTCAKALTAWGKSENQKLVS